MNIYFLKDRRLRDNWRNKRHTFMPQETDALIPMRPQNSNRNQTGYGGSNSYEHIGPAI